MKEMTRISLASIPYNIEVAAKKELEQYLTAIESSLGADNEAMKEIEARIAELLSGRGVTSEKVASSEDIHYVKEQLGDPKEFIDDTAPVTGAGKQEKRLMRDSSNEMLGGVCSGFGAYAKIDTVWVRLAAVILAFVTSGFFVLVYIVLWIVTPPAKTATERLQMKGEAVTLPALQAESDVAVHQKDNSRRIVTVLRILMGIGAIGTGIVALVVTATIVWNVIGAYDSRFTGLHVVYFGLMVLAGLLFTLMCWLGGYMLVRGTMNKRLIIGLSSIVILGLLTFGIGATGIAFGLRAQDAKNEAEYNKTRVNHSLDATAISGTKRLVVDSTLPMYVNYTAKSSGAPEASLRYNSRDVSAKPNVTFDREGETLHIWMDNDDKKCLSDRIRCQNVYTLTLSGPVLEMVAATNNSQVHYMTDRQPTLSVASQTGGKIEIQSSGVIDRVDATLASESTLHTKMSAITALNLTIEDAQSNAYIATVRSLNLTVPTACAANHNGGSLSVERAESITVNGQVFQKEADYPCVEIDVDTVAKSQ